MLCCLSTFCAIITILLLTGLCVSVHKTGRPECICYFRKVNLKDEKEELGRINKL